jgi:hypothetical protein
VPKEELCAKGRTMCQRKDCVPKEELCAKGRTVLQRKQLNVSQSRAVLRGTYVLPAALGAKFRN